MMIFLGDIVLRADAARLGAMRRRDHAVCRCAGVESRQCAEYAATVVVEQYHAQVAAQTFVPQRVLVVEVLPAHLHLL